jgi:imidazolonepropionase-like amidohydrolase
MSEPALHLSATLLPRGDAPVDLWIERGHISLRPVDGARELGPKPWFATAGLVDSHTHLCFVPKPGAPNGRAVVDANRRLHLEAGSLLLRDLGATSDDVLGVPDDDDLPVVHAAGQSLLKEHQMPFFATSPDDLPGAVAAQARAGAKWAKIFADWPGWNGRQEEPNFGPNDPLTYDCSTLTAAVRAAEAAGARVAIHAFGREAAAVGIEAGVHSIEHGWGLDEGLLDAMAEKKIAWTPMLGIAAPMLNCADVEQAKWIRGTLARMDVLVPHAHRRGVILLAGTDWFPMVTLADDLRCLVRHGLTTADAIAAATTTARAYHHAPDIGDGAPANLILYEKDPREDLARLPRPDLVMLRGRVVHRRLS